jgi:hypothetical protein
LRGNRGRFGRAPQAGREAVGGGPPVSGQPGRPGTPLHKPRRASIVVAGSQGTDKPGGAWPRKPRDNVRFSASLPRIVPTVAIPRPVVACSSQPPGCMPTASYELECSTRGCPQVVHLSSVVTRTGVGAGEIDVPVRAALAANCCERRNGRRFVWARGSAVIGGVEFLERRDVTERGRRVAVLLVSGTCCAVLASDTRAGSRRAAIVAATGPWQRCPGRGPPRSGASHTCEAVVRTGRNETGLLVDVEVPPGPEGGHARSGRSAFQVCRVRRRRRGLSRHGCQLTDVGAAWRPRRIRIRLCSASAWRTVRARDRCWKGHGFCQEHRLTHRRELERRRRLDG